MEPHPERAVIERIMVPLDGSEFGEFALPVAVDVARRADGELELVHVNDPFPAVPEELAPELSLEEASGRYLKNVSERVVEAWDGPVAVRVMRGPVVRSLEAASRDLGADLVVMATHGRGPLSRLWLGSVADGFVRHSPAPVLLVRPREEEGPELAEGPDFERVLLPLDRTDLTLEIVEPAVEFGALYDARYHLVTVVTRPTEYMDAYVPEAVAIDDSWFEDARDQARRRLEAEAERMKSRGLDVEVTVVQRSSPASGILDVAEDWEADLIAMSTHGRGGVPRMLLGSVSDKVARGSARPVLLYRPPEG